MGQAYDERGNPLGERIYGDSELEVMKKLVNLHPKASEYRIQSLKNKFEEAEKSLREKAKIEEE